MEKMELKKRTQKAVGKQQETDKKRVARRKEEGE
jgi:hypothetical protein